MKPSLLTLKSLSTLILQPLSLKITLERREGEMIRKTTRGKINVTDRDENTSIRTRGPKRTEGRRRRQLSQHLRRIFYDSPHHGIRVGEIIKKGR